MILEATQGTLIEPGNRSRFSGVSINSRALEKDQVFWCIRGDRFDGHDFIGQALNRGASGVVLSDKEKFEPVGDAFCVQVPDTLKALQDLARHHRRACGVKVVGITGTNGKSTTKEMTAAVLSTKFSTLKSRGNLNNHIGLPLNLLELTPDHEIAVLEMGMSASGEIARLAAIAEPSVGLITNISEAHLVQLKNIREVQSAKGELFDALPEDGIALVNADDPLVLELAQSLRCRVIRYGSDPSLEIRATGVKSRGVEGTEFTLHVGDEAVDVRLPVPGRCNVSNALAAAATGFAMGIPLESIADALSGVQLMGQRAEVTRQQGLILLNDSYNANPKSMEEALRTFSELEAAGRKFCVLGDMLEMGELEKSAHQELGRQVAAHGFDFLVTVGPRARLTAEAARQAGMDSSRVSDFSAHEEAAAYLKDQIKEQDALLFKGSRGARMERVLELLLEAR